ncbi:MAG: energy transducer TonB [Bacteroides sp. SM23_62_1]|nr:MAG: energy transducer TonB [Bacteroides sp. SM23_62_1]
MVSKKTEKADLEKKKGVFLQIGLVIVLAIILVAFEWTSRPNTLNTLGELADLDLTEEIIPITRQQEIKPPPPPAPPKVTEVLNIVEDDVQIEDELIIEDAEADQQMQIDIIEFSEEEEVVEEEVFFIVEDMPSFQGKGQEGFREWIAQNLRYPEIAAENGISGKVYVQFAVNSKGEVVDAMVVRGVDPALDKEAIRVVMSSPKWEPGKQRGKPVKVQFTFPINFVLQ